MLRVESSINKKELHKIAKTIQWHYKSSFAQNYKQAFSYIRKVARYDEEKKYKLRLAIENCLTPSNKLHNSSETIGILNSLGIYNNDYIEYQYITFLSKFRVPTLKTITSDLKILMNDFEGINFSGDCLTVEMGPFTLEGVHFGNFQVSFDMRNFCLVEHGSVPSAKAVTPNRPSDDDEHTHPHVRGNEVCIGNGRGPLDKAITQARLQDCFEIVRSVLSTYNGADPFAPIIKWTGMRCKNCDAYYESEEAGSTCNKCERTYCENCVAQCCSASDFACYRCLPVHFSCAYCGNVR
jgi:hypothetical protein